MMAKFCMQTRTDHVQNICWVLYLKGSSLPKKMTFLYNCLHVGLQFCSDDGSAFWLAACSYSDLQVCRYLIDLSGKQLVCNKIAAFQHTSSFKGWHRDWGPMLPLHTPCFDQSEISCCSV